MQGLANFKFWGRLQQLASSASEGAAVYRFSGHPGIKDSIEALGIPHTEVDLILVSGRSVSFGYRLQDRDWVEVYPFGHPVSADSTLRLSPALPAEVAFILDVHLGKLARRLRLLGFNCRYRNDYRDSQIIQLALESGLIILTRDRGILKHACVTQGYLVGSAQVDAQVHEVLQRYSLYDRIEALRRCPKCNGLLRPVDKEKIRHRLQEKTAQYYHRFQLCPDCERIYWQGSHYAKLKGWLRQFHFRAEDDSMDFEQLRSYLLSKPEAIEDFPFDATTLVLKVGGKMFAALGINDDPLRVNLKCDPQKAEILREQYPAVLPGYHMNKRHWNTLVLDGSLPKAEVRAMIDESYELVVKGLPKAQRPK